MSTGAYKVNFEEIKRAVSMEKLIGFLTLPGLRQKSARQWKGTCPFCGGADCFVVTNDGGRDKTGAFNCFKCPAGGDQIELVSLVRGNARKDAKGVFAAAKELHEKFVAGPVVAATNGSANASPQPQSQGQRRFDAEAYAKGLDPAHEALASLGVDAETFRTWKSGYASSGINRGRLALPVTGKDGVVIGYVGRTVKEESPTFTFPNGLAPQDHIFGINRVTAGQLYLVRDPIDVLKAYEAGYENVVCFLTEDISGTQLQRLAAVMADRQCTALSFF